MVRFFIVFFRVFISNATRLKNDPVRDAFIKNVGDDLSENTTGIRLVEACRSGDPEKIEGAISEALCFPNLYECIEEARNLLVNIENKTAAMAKRNETA